CDADGNVIVVDSGNDRLQVFTPDGKALTQCGRSGSGEEGFNKPWGITLDNEGNIYVADWKNHRVQKLSPSGEVIMSIGKYGTLPIPENAFARAYLGPFLSPTAPPGAPQAGILNHPTDVAVDADGDIYVADWGNHRLCIFDAEGTPAHPPGGRCPGDVEVGTAEHRRQSRHDEGVPAGAQSRASLARLFYHSGGIVLGRIYGRTSPALAYCRDTRPRSGLPPP